MTECPKRSALVAEYWRKPMRKFLQIDAWREDEPRMYEPHYTDEVGDVAQAINTWELRNTNCPVRIQIPVDADKELVITLLRKILHKLENGWGMNSKPSAGRGPTATVGWTLGFSNALKTRKIDMVKTSGRAGNKHRKWKVPVKLSQVPEHQALLSEFHGMAT